MIVETKKVEDGFFIPMIKKLLEFSKNNP